MDQVPAMINLTASTNNRRYYCHSCRAEVLVSVDFKCMQCSGGFVEEMRPGTPSNIPRLLRLLQRTAPVSPNGSEIRSFNNTTPSTNLDENNNCNLNNNEGSNNASVSSSSDSMASTSSAIDPNANGNENNPSNLGTILGSGNGRADNFRGVIMNVLMDVLDLLGGVTPESPGSLAQTETPQSSNRTMSDHVRNIIATRYAATGHRDNGSQNALNAFFDFAFGSLGGGGGHGGITANVNLGNQTFVQMGGQNDPARQDHDLTNVLVNTLNRLLPTVSRPLSNDKLELIPKVEVTAADLASQNMCAICWDNFQLQETVRKLPCSHLFHEPCVFPWLKLHRTCPLCRDCLTEDAGLGGLISMGPRPLNVENPETFSLDITTDTSSEEN